MIRVNLAALLLLVTTPANALIVLSSSRIATHVQGSGGLSEGNSIAQFRVDVTNDTLSGPATLQLPGGSSLPLTASGSSAAATNLYHNNLAAQTAALPAGGYRFQFGTAGTGAFDLGFNHDGNLRPVAIPRITNFGSLATLDPAQPFTLLTNGFLPSAWNSSLYLLISEMNGGPTILHNVSLADHGAGAFLIPANSFTVGRSYGFQIDWGANQSSRVGDIVTVDSFRYNTNGVFSVNGPAAAVPEPASWALLITGFAMVGAAQRRRRQAVPTLAR